MSDTIKDEQQDEQPARKEEEDQQSASELVVGEETVPIAGKAKLESGAFADHESDRDASTTDSDSDAGLSPVEDHEGLVVQAVTLKEEGNSFFKAGDLVKASRSYRKGTSMLKKLNRNDTGDEQVKALILSLQNNLSMVCFKQDKIIVSRDLATNALSVDSTNVKALYRRAVANRKLGNIGEARNDLKEALRHDPNNTAVKKELAGVKREADAAAQREKKRLQKAFSKSGSFLYHDKEKEEQRKEEEKKRKEEREKETRQKRKEEWEDECVKRMADDRPPLSLEEWEKELKAHEEEVKRQKDEQDKQQREKRRKAQAEEKKSLNATCDASDEDDGDELTEKELAMLRGYKKTSDGRTTSYFTRELSENEKKMLGDTAPKRLGDSISASAIQGGTVKSLTSKQTRKGSASAWNQAGTWEEKDSTDWCTSHLRSKLQSASALEGSCLAIVTSVKQLSGDASVAIIGGKKRYIFDFTSVVEFDIRSISDEEVLGSGSLRLPDICSTSHEELEIDALAWRKIPADAHEAGALKCREELVHRVRLSVKEFVADFNAQY